MIDVSKLKLNENGLIPAIVTDSRSGKVLMMAYMNKESIERTEQTGLACFWSRSRNQLWTKGETSGNFLHVVSVTSDCDSDTLLISALPVGPACHTGAYSCFTNELWRCEEENAFSLQSLMELIKGRKAEKKDGSYTSYLFEKGLDKILKKIGEESTEVIIAAKACDKKDTVYEIADLTYHVLVLMAEAGISIDDIYSELASRHVIDKKIKQEKMT